MTIYSYTFYHDVSSSKVISILFISNARNEIISYFGMSCVIKPTITLCVIKINKAVTLRAEIVVNVMSK